MAGLAGAALVAQFAVSLIRTAAATLLDMNPSPELTAEVRARLEAEGERWPTCTSGDWVPAIMPRWRWSAPTHPPGAEAYHARLKGFPASAT